MKKFLTFAATLLLGAVSISNSFAQADLGAACGCPPVASRTTVVDLSTLADASGNINDSNLVLTCDKMWRLDKKIYVGSGKTITIMPGTVIKGVYTVDPALASALIISRGAKIIAAGDKDCQIVFTAEGDNLDGTYPVSTVGRWGGLVLCGRAANNLTTGNTLYIAGSTGIGRAEGFASGDPRVYYGGSTDNDNSGVLRYVSLRHAGANLAAGFEINALTLCSVGSGTSIEHVETVSCNDDNIELFGGTVNLKYISTLFGNDDMLDYDQGWTGKCQFFFGIKRATNDTTGTTSDNGIEADADDQKINSCPRSHPFIYNMTLIGSGKHYTNADNSGVAGIMAKELTEGEIYNSVFANFKYGVNIQKTPGTRVSTSICGTSTVVGEAYDNWNQLDAVATLKIKNCTFVANDYSFRLNQKSNTAISVDDSTKFFGDGNVNIPAVTGFAPVWAMNSTTNAVTTQFDAIPNPAIASSITPPVDGFYSPANYRGAFSPTGSNWLSDWSYVKILDMTAGLVPCPTDLNGSTNVDVDDFLIFLGTFGSSCQ